MQVFFQYSKQNLDLFISALLGYFPHSQIHCDLVIFVCSLALNQWLEVEEPSFGVHLS